MFAGTRIKGLVIGLVGVGLLGYALFTIFSVAGCATIRGAVPAPGCDDPGGLVALAIPAGIIIAIVGIFMGGGMVVFGALFMGVGLAALLPAMLGIMGEMQLFGWLFGGIFFVCGLFPFAGGALLGRVALRKQAVAMELMRSGVKGVGTIVEVADTGITINDNPRIRIRMRIEPVDGSAAVERSKTVTVSRVAIPRAGERYPAWFDRADPDKWMFGTDLDEAAASPEVREMFARARGRGGDAREEDAAPGPVEELAKLSALWRDGALTDSEFAEAKARLLRRIGR